jgi:hypothetical protein
MFPLKRVYVTTLTSLRSVLVLECNNCERRKVQQSSAGTETTPYVQKVRTQLSTLRGNKGFHLYAVGDYQSQDMH